ncbi:MAG: hypothetical protein DRI90_02435 [Deltaproteobacteria bacterium]|nr:MAG: hypothetical protein DRI90_02435 [Deltaproteobacteria bacterium]
MALRLIVGLLKGLVLGGLVGYGLLAAGLSWGWLAYPAAALVGVLVAMVAGKPIWAEDARIEVGMKSAAGAILAPGMMWLVRHFLTMGLPFDPSALPGLASVSASSVTLGTFFVTSLALVGAVLAGFFDADNQPGGAEQKGASQAKAGRSKQRIATEGRSADISAAEAEAAEAEAAQRQRRN